MHEHHEDITKVALLLTEPSQVIEAGPGEGEPQAALHICGSRVQARYASISPVCSTYVSSQ
jgi:hypothetical protein